MTATNHAVTGALIVALTPNPILGLVLAFFSHFVLDTLPHFDEAGIAKKMNKQQHVALLAGDGFLAVCIVVLMIALSGLNPWLLVAAGITAMLPDAMWLRYYLNGTIHKVDSYGPFASIHKRVQGPENQNGIVVEIAWLILALAVFYTVAVY